MWDLTNPSREMLLELASIVHPWSDGEGVSEMFVPDALGPGEASAPNWRLTSRRCRVKVHPKVPGPGFAPGRRGPTGDRVGIASDVQEKTPTKLSRSYWSTPTCTIVFFEMLIKKYISSLPALVDVALTDRFKDQGLVRPSKHFNCV